MSTTQSTQERADQLGSESIGRLLLRFAAPAILTMLVSSLYNIVDKIFVGNLVGELGLSAVSAVSPITRIITAFGMLVGGGGSTLLALRLGEGRHKEAEEILGNAFLLLLCIMIPLSILGGVFRAQILGLFGTGEDVLPYATAYLAILMCSATFEGISSGFGMFIRTDGSPRRMMVCSMTGCIFNIIMDPILISLLGLQGAALATALSQVLSGLLVLHYFLFSKKSTIKLRLHLLRLKAVLTKEICKLGSSSFVQQFLGGVVNAILLWCLNFYGQRYGENSDLAVAAVGVTVSVGLFFLLPILGMQQAIQPIVSYNYGAEKYDRVLKTLRIGLTIAVGYGFVGWAVMMIAAEPLSMLFGAEGDFLEQTIFTLRIYNLLFPFVGIGNLGGNFFQAVGQPVKATFISLSRQLLFLVPAIMILPLFMGMNGVIWGLPVADLGSVIVAAILLVRETGRLKGMQRLQAQ